MIPAKSDFPKQYRGTSFKGRRITLSRTDGGVTTPIDLTGAVINMNFRTAPSQPITKTFVNNSGITVVDAVNGVLNIDSFMVNLAPTKYIYELKVTYPSGVVDVYLTGTFEVLPNQG